MNLRYNIRHSALGGLWGLGAPLLVSIIASIILIIAGGEESALGNSVAFNVIISIITELSFFLVFYIISRRTQTDWVQASSVRNVSPWYLYIIAAILGILCVFLFNPIISLWEQLLSLIGYDISGELPMPLDSVGMLILAIFAVALIPAICEEFLYRGLVLNGLRKYGVWVSVLTSALLFSLMHMNLQQLPYTFILGVIFGLIVYYTRNIWLSIIMHFLNNATAILIMYFATNSSTEFVWWHILVALGCVIVACGIIWLVVWLIKKKDNKATEQDPLDTQTILPAAQRNKLMLTPILAGVLFLILFSLINFGVI